MASAINPESSKNTKDTQNVETEAAEPEFIYINEDSCSDNNDDENSGDGVTKQLRMLSFANPGKFMDNFDPERSAREMRKMNRRIYRENVKKNQMYDETGLLLENSSDLCDCLDVDCYGCHFPCSKCNSTKCATECRQSRKWIYEQVEVEGTGVTIKWPFK